MTGRPPPVGVLGGGSFGTTLAHHVAANGHPTLLWLRDEAVAEEIRSNRTNGRYLADFTLAAGIEPTSSLEEVARECHLILVAIPSSGFRTVARALGDHVTGEQILVSGTKGLERGTYSRMSEILREETCCKKVGALSGPNLSREMMAGMPGATVAASKFDEVIVEVEKALRGPTLRIYGNHDVIGVELGGALKNIYAIASGVVAGLGFGENTKGLLLTRGLSEMGGLGEKMGADPRTFAGLAGVGDLITTAMSTLSRNFRIGRAVGEGKTVEEAIEEVQQVAEGIPISRVASEWSVEHNVYMPITRAMNGILHQGLSTTDAISGLMRLPSLYEVDSTPLSS